VTAAGVAQTDLEPTRVASRTYLTRRRDARLDASTIICIMVVLLLLIPSRYIVPGMTDLGRPGLIVGLLLIAWWVTVRMTPHLVQPGPQPIRWALLGFTIAMLVSYPVAQLREVTSIEASGADRHMLYLGIFAGVALAAADGIKTWERLHRVLVVLVACAAIVAVIGILQFVLRIDLTRFLAIPGLEEKFAALGFEERGDDIRVASTTTHYIELSTTLATILPFALQMTLFPTDPRRRRLAAIASVLIAGGAIVTISRSGILAMAIVLLMLFPAWSWRLRYNMLWVGVLMVGGLVVAKPSLVQTLASLFLDASEDNSVKAREDDYPLVWSYFTERPWLGRGTGTFIPPQYEILDNQWLMYLVANGIVGVVLFAAMHITAIVIAVRAARRAATRAVRHLCMGLAGTQLVAMAVAGTYDSMSFFTYATLVALTLGMCGTVWRLTHPNAAIRTAAPRWFAGDPNAAQLGHYIRPARGPGAGE
jgi:O-antigen ligase